MTDTLENHILPTLGDVSMAKLTTATVRRWHADLLTGGLGPSTVAKCYRLLRAILNTAVEDSHLVANPCSIKGAGVEPSDERRIATIDEVYALTDTVPPRLRTLVLLAAFSGLRLGELFALTRRDIDLLHRTLDARAQRQESKRGIAIIGPPKSAAGRRVISLPTEIMSAIEDHLAQWVEVDPDALVFVGERGAPLRSGVWQHEWARARTKIGRPDLRFHDLRHVAATLAAATGASTKQLMRWLGHATPQAALRYQHATDDRDRVIAAGIDDIIRASRTATADGVVALRDRRAR